METEEEDSDTRTSTTTSSNESMKLEDNGECRRRKRKKRTDSQTTMSPSLVTLQWWLSASLRLDFLRHNSKKRQDPDMPRGRDTWQDLPY